MLKEGANNSTIDGMSDIQSLKFTISRDPLSISPRILILSVEEAVKARQKQVAKAMEQLGPVPENKTGRRQIRKQ